MRHFLVPALAALMALGFGVQARAGIAGTMVTVQAYEPDLSSLFATAGPAVVGPGMEFGVNSLQGYGVNFDLSDSQIAIGYPSAFATGFIPSAFNGFAFTFSSVIPIGASIDPTSAFAPVAFGLVGNTLFLNYSGVTVPPNSFSLIDLRFGPVAGVPEPSEWALMIMGLGGVGAALRLGRRVRAAAIV